MSNVTVAPVLSLCCVCFSLHPLCLSPLILAAPFAHRSRRFKLAKKTIVAVADALERTVPLQDILANAVWLGDKDIIGKYSGTLHDEHEEHRWVDKFAFVGRKQNRR